METSKKGKGGGASAAAAEAKARSAIAARLSEAATLLWDGIYRGDCEQSGGAQARRDGLGPVRFSFSYFSVCISALLDIDIY